jgi:tRNA(Ile)-lysidine synthase
MADTRRSAPVEPRAAAASRVDAAVLGAIRAHVRRGARVGVALSGGRDSVALLDAVARIAPAFDLELLAIHVDHGLSRSAGAWASFCAALAQALGIELSVRNVTIDPRDARGIEAAARHERYAAIAEVAHARSVEAVMLAQHQDDQAETVLLQLARGAGPHGLAAMPAASRDAAGVEWLRPLLGVARADIEAYVAHRSLRYVDDDSNRSPKHRRNALRHDVVPALSRLMPGYPATLARAAAHQAEAALLLDDLAALDAGDGDGLECARLAALEPYRARNALRWYLRQRGLRAPSTARLDAMLAQLRAPRRDARVAIAHDGAAIGVHRGRIVVHAPSPAPFVRMWHGEPLLELPHGRLLFEPVLGEGISADRLARNAVVVRPREGGERAQFDANRPRRALKAWLQEAGIPQWERRSLPLVFCGDTLVAAPGVGIDMAFQAAGEERAWRIEWQPDERPRR